MPSFSWDRLTNFNRIGFIIIGLDKLGDSITRPSNYVTGLVRRPLSLACKHRHRDLFFWFVSPLHELYVDFILITCPQLFVASIPLSSFFSLLFRHVSHFYPCTLKLLSMCSWSNPLPKPRSIFSPIVSITSIQSRTFLRDFF